MCKTNKIMTADEAMDVRMCIAMAKAARVAAHNNTVEMRNYNRRVAYGFIADARKIIAG